MTARSFGRRQLVAGAAAGLLGCTGARRSTTRATDSTTVVTSPLPDDKRSAVYAAGLEALAIAAYEQIFDLLNTKKLPAPAPAIGVLINTSAAHHRAHLDAWNAALTRTAHGAVTEPDPGLIRVLAPLVQKAISIGAAEAALSIEQLVAANYVTITPLLGAADTIRLAGSVEIVEMQHVAALLYLLNKPPVPNAYANDALSQ